MAIKTLTIKERLSTKFDDYDSLNAECKSIASEIIEKNINLVSVVEALGPFMTSNEIDMIKNSVHTLSQILSHLPKNLLNSTEMTLLFTFYIERLKDHYTILHPALSGILFLLQMENLPPTLITKMFQELLTQVHCQTLQRPERSVIFQILKYALQNETILKRLKESCESEFVSGVMNAIDGERDPRHLLLLFEMLPTFFESFELGNITEDAFEIIACYFPVDYNPVQSDESLITRDLLAAALADCLSAPLFLDHSMPLILEKLSSSLKVAKMDSLHLLQKCLANLQKDPNPIKSRINELWISLKEAAMSSDPEIKELVLETITKLMEAINEDVMLRQRMGERAVDDTKWILSNVQLSTFWSSERILAAVARASDAFCQQTLKFVVPVCLGQYSCKRTTEEKNIILKTLRDFLEIAAQFKIDIQSMPELSWTDIPSLLTKELETPSNDITIEVLHCFNAQRAFINAMHRNTLYKNLCNYIETGNDALKKTCLLVLDNFVQTYPNEISDFIIDRFSLESDKIEPNILKCRLEVLSILAKEPEIGTKVLPVIVKIATSSSPLNTYALNCLNQSVSSSTKNFNIPQFLHQTNTIAKLLAKIDKTTPENRLKFTATVCAKMIQNLSIKEQEILMDNYVKDLANLNEDTISIYEMLLIPLNCAVISKIDISSCFEKLVQIALESEFAISRLAACKIVAVLIHKKVNEKGFVENLVVPVKRRVIEILRGGEALEKKKAAVMFHTWLTKSAVIGGIEPLHGECITDQIDFLRHHEVGEIVAESFETLINKNEDTLTKENGCRIMFLYKQRIFENLLIENVFDGAERRNFLIALTLTLDKVQPELLLLHMPTIVPILVESLTLTESKLLMPILKTLQELLQRRHDIFAEEAKAIIPNIIELVSHKEMKIRIAAIECLNAYCDYQSMAVYSFKADVLDKLEESIDDHKRLVRKIAVITRSRWFMYEQPTP